MTGDLSAQQLAILESIIDDAAEAAERFSGSYSTHFEVTGLTEALFAMRQFDRLAGITPTGHVSATPTTSPGTGGHSGPGGYRHGRWAVRDSRTHLPVAGERPGVLHPAVSGYVQPYDLIREMSSALGGAGGGFNVTNNIVSPRPGDAAFEATHQLRMAAALRGF